jgi:hypothetical protein
VHEGHSKSFGMRARLISLAYVLLVKYSITSSLNVCQMALINLLPSWRNLILPDSLLRKKMTEPEVSRTDFRVMIFYDFKRGISFTESHENLTKAFGDHAVSLHTVRRWYDEFQHGRASFEDEPRSGRPREVVTAENVERVRQLIKDQRNITYEEIEETLGIGAAAVKTILHEHLRVRKIASRWVPHLLSEDQKQARVDWCHFMLKKFDGGRSKSVWNIFTGDESWIYACDPETKQQSTVWVFEDEPPPTKVTRSRSVAKQMVAVFFDVMVQSRRSRLWKGGL